MKTMLFENSYSLSSLLKKKEFYSEWKIKCIPFQIKTIITILLETACSIHRKFHIFYS